MGVERGGRGPRAFKAYVAWLCKTHLVGYFDSEGAAARERDRYTIACFGPEKCFGPDVDPKLSLPSGHKRLNYPLSAYRREPFFTVLFGPVEGKEKPAVGVWDPEAVSNLSPDVDRPWARLQEFMEEHGQSRVPLSTSFSVPSELSDDESEPSTGFSAAPPRTPSAPPGGFVSDPSGLHSTGAAVAPDAEGPAERTGPPAADAAPAAEAAVKSEGREGQGRLERSWPLTRAERLLADEVEAANRAMYAKKRAAIERQVMELEREGAVGAVCFQIANKPPFEFGSPPYLVVYRLFGEVMGRLRPGQAFSVLSVPALAAPAASPAPGGAPAADPGATTGKARGPHEPEADAADLPPLRQWPPADAPSPDAASRSGGGRLRPDDCKGVIFRGKRGQRPQAYIDWLGTRRTCPCASRAQTAVTVEEAARTRDRFLIAALGPDGVQRRELNFPREEYEGEPFFRGLPASPVGARDPAPGSGAAWERLKAYMCERLSIDSAPCERCGARFGLVQLSGHKRWCRRRLPQAEGGGADVGGGASGPAEPVADAAMDEESTGRGSAAEGGSAVVHVEPPAAGSPVQRLESASERGADGGLEERACSSSVPRAGAGSDSAVRTASGSAGTIGSSVAKPETRAASSTVHAGSSEHSSGGDGNACAEVCHRIELSRPAALSPALRERACAAPAEVVPLQPEASSGSAPAAAGEGQGARAGAKVTAGSLRGVRAEGGMFRPHLTWLQVKRLLPLQPTAVEAARERDRHALVCLGPAEARLNFPLQTYSGEPFYVRLFWSQSPPPVGVHDAGSADRDDMWRAVESFMAECRREQPAAGAASPTGGERGPAPPPGLQAAAGYNGVLVCPRSGEFFPCVQWRGKSRCGPATRTLKAAAVEHDRLLIAAYGPVEAGIGGLLNFGLARYERERFFQRLFRPAARSPPAVGARDWSEEGTDEASGDEAWARLLEFMRGGGLERRRPPAGEEGAPAAKRPRGREAAPGGPADASRDEPPARLHAGHGELEPRPAAGLAAGLAGAHTDFELPAAFFEAPREPAAARLPPPAADCPLAVRPPRPPAEPQAAPPPPVAVPVAQGAAIHVRRPDERSGEPLFVPAGAGLAEVLAAAAAALGCPVRGLVSNATAREVRSVQELYASKVFVAF